MLARVGTEAADQGGRDGVSVTIHCGEGSGHVGDIGQHHRVGDEARVFELFLLLDEIAALDDGSAERDPVEEVIEGLDLGSLGADRAPDSVSAMNRRRNSVRSTRPISRNAR